MNEFISISVSALLLTCLSGCGDTAPVAREPRRVVAQVAKLAPYSPRMALTGAIEARVLSDLSFRVGGRIVERTVDVGTHVEADQVLARLDTQEQRANLDSAKASVDAAEAKLRQDSASFERQKALLEKGFTTRKDHDQAEESFRTSLNSLEGARAQLSTAGDLLSYTSLRAPAAGVITARNIEVGQVAQAASMAFTIALDGARDAVFDVYEAAVAKEGVADVISIALLSDRNIVASGKVREISPTIDITTGAVRISVGLDDPPAAMALGAIVFWAAGFKHRDLIALPWTALASVGGKPAVWVVDPQSEKVAQKPITIAAFRTGELLVKDGLQEGDIVVTAGAQLLRPNEVVSFARERQK